MLADKSLLAVTLAATFVAGSVSGYAVRDMRNPAPFQPTSAKSVYAKTFQGLRDRGYNDAELAAAMENHQAYLDAYGTWWTDFLDAHRDSLNAVDARFTRECDALEVRFRARNGTSAR